MGYLTKMKNLTTVENVLGYLSWLKKKLMTVQCNCTTTVPQLTKDISMVAGNRGQLPACGNCPVRSCEKSKEWSKYDGGIIILMFNYFSKLFVSCLFHHIVYSWWYIRPIAGDVEFLRMHACGDFRSCIHNERWISPRTLPLNTNNVATHM